MAPARSRSSEPHTWASWQNEWDATKKKCGWATSGTSSFSRNWTEKNMKLMFYRRTNHKATASTLVFLEPYTQGIRGWKHVYTMRLTKNTPAAPQYSRRTEGCQCPAFDLSTDMLGITVNPHYHACVWSQLVGCMRQKLRMQKHFGCSRHCKSQTNTKVKLAWLPPRHRNITIPLCCHWFRKLL